MKFFPENLPKIRIDDISSLLSHVYRQFSNVSKIHEGQTPFDGIHFVPQHAPILNPETGLVLYADGTDWNPGSGAGLYYWNGSNWIAI